MTVSGNLGHVGRSPSSFYKLQTGPSPSCRWQGPLEFLCLSWCTQLGFLFQASCSPASSDLAQTGSDLRLLESEELRTEAGTPAQAKYRGITRGRENSLLGLPRFTLLPLWLPPAVLGFCAHSRAPGEPPHPELGKSDLILHLLSRSLVELSPGCSHSEDQSHPSVPLLRLPFHSCARELLMTPT